MGQQGGRFTLAPTLHVNFGKFSEAYHYISYDICISLYTLYTRFRSQLTHQTCGGKKVILNHFSLAGMLPGF